MKEKEQQSWLSPNYYFLPVICDRGWKRFSIKGQVVNTLGFSSHNTSVTATLALCHEGGHAHYGNEYMWLCSHNNSFTKQVVAGI